MSNSRSLQNSIQNAWCSARLVYRAIENNDADRSFVGEAIWKDPSILALWNTSILRPQSNSSFDGFYERNKKRPLAVIICLRTSSDPKMNHQHNTTTNGVQHPNNKQHAKDTMHATASAPVPIGVLSLTEPELEQHHNRCTTLGIALADAYQGKGYGPEAINWALDWAFKFGSMH